MDPEFWRQAWRERNIGFHRDAPNPLLMDHWRSLGVESDALVLVPLAGKSLDMRWLREQGHRVLAVELSPIAVGEFFAETGIEPRRTTEGPFEVWASEGFRVLQGNFFDVGKEHLTGVRAVYDRAALVALPPEMRASYVQALTERLPTPVSILLIAMESSPFNPEGPPFSVTETEVRRLYEPAFTVEVLCRTPFVDEKRRDGSTQSRSSVAYAIRSANPSSDTRRGSKTPARASRET